MEAKFCPEYAELELRLDESLQKVAQSAALQLEIFRSKNLDSFMRIDKELELALGDKERAVGAFVQHVKDHGCQKASNVPAA